MKKNSKKRMPLWLAALLTAILIAAVLELGITMHEKNKAPSQVPYLVLSLMGFFATEPSVLTAVVGYDENIKYFANQVIFKI